MLFPQSSRLRFFSFNQNVLLPSLTYPLGASGHLLIVPGRAFSQWAPIPLSIPLYDALILMMISNCYLSLILSGPLRHMFLSFSIRALPFSRLYSPLLVSN